MRLHIALLIALLLSASSTAGQPSAGLNLIDSALSQVGMTRAEVRFDHDELEVFQGHRWRLSHFSLFHRSPFKLPYHSD